MLKTLSAILLALLFHLAIEAQTVPSNWLSLYNELETKLNSIDNALNAKWNGEKYCSYYCTNLMPANSAKGHDLLTQLPSLYAVKKHLDAFQTMGVNCIDLAIQYPVLVDSFPHSDDYLNYYKQVVQEIKNRDMKIIIGCQATVRDTVYGHLNVDTFYIGLNTIRYKAEKLQMLQTIIDSLQPDYLTIEMEPQTQEENLGLDFSIDSVMNYIEYFMSRINKKGVQIGAGSGTWDDLVFIDKIAQRTDIDFIDYHIYPVNQDCFVDKVFKIGSIAKFYEKKLVIGECWLHKATDEDLVDPAVAPAEIFSRDVFSFWIPLDSLFFNSVMKLSHYSKVEITSFIWSNLFFAYIDYTQEHDALSPGQLLNMAYAAVSENLLSNILSPTGELYKKLIEDACSGPNIVKNALRIENSNISVYPNPFNHSTIMEFTNNKNEAHILTIYNLNGQVVRLINNIQSSRIKIERSNLNNGIYFFQLRNNKEIIGKGKLIVK